MEIREITRLTDWNSFFEENGSESFLQSWEWGEFENSLGYGVFRVGVYDDKSLLAIAQFIEVKAKRGSFVFVPHGPVFKKQLVLAKIHRIVEGLLAHLKDIARKKNFAFIRIAPALRDNPKNAAIFLELGFQKAPIYMHAERLWVLDISKSEEELLQNMRKTTRYLVKRAIRDGVTVEKRLDDKTIDDFWKIYQETAERENFVPFSQSFIRKEFEAFKKTGKALFLFGKIPPNKINPKGILASALIIFTKSTAFYHQGASIHTKIPVTYLEQWEAIKEAKSRGCKYYNFWGILQEGRSPKNWHGLTLFKTGFGGEQIDYLPTQDFIISPKYYITYLYEKFLAWRRGV